MMMYLFPVALGPRYIHINHNKYNKKSCIVSMTWYTSKKKQNKTKQNKTKREKQLQLFLTMKMFFI